MNKLKDLLIDILGISAIDIEKGKTLADMGMDSISIVEYQIEIARALHISEDAFQIMLNDNLYSLTEKLKGL